MVTVIEQDDAAEIAGQLGRILQMQEMAEEHCSHNTKPNRPRSRRQQRTEHGTKRSPQHGAPRRRSPSLRVCEAERSVTMTAAINA